MKKIFKKQGGWKVKREHLLKAIVVCFTVLTTAFSAGIGFCDSNVLVEEGKTKLFQDIDPYGADAKFEAALDPNQGGDPANEKANFWRAVTVIATNSDLNTILKNMVIIDAGNNLIVLDEEGQPKKDILSKVDDIIIDSDIGSPGYSEVGEVWVQQGGSGYGDDYRTHAAGGSGTNKAVWTPNITVAGDYYISMWWGYSANNSPDAEVSIYYEDDDGTQTTRTFTLNQLQDCDGWSKLVKFGRLSPDKNHRVEISDKGTGSQVIADAVKFVFDTDVMDDQSAGVVFNNGSSLWQDVLDDRARGGVYKKIAAGTGGSCVYTPTIPADGKYRLEIEYIGSTTNASDAAYEIRVDGTLVDTVYINQQIDDHSRCNFGMYEFEAGTVNTVTLLQNSSGKVSVDTLRIISVRYDPTLTEIQNVSSSTLTQADIALGYLGNVSEAFQDTVTVDTYTAEIDCGDALMLKSFLNLYKAQANTFAAYNMDNLSPTKIASTYEELISINWILDTYANLGELNDGADTKLTAAKAALIEGINRYFDGYNSIKGEIDLQDNDFITFDPGDSEGIEAVNAKLDEVLKNLNGELESFTVSSDDFDFDPDESYFKAEVDLGAFFDNPTAPRSLLPSFDDEDILIRSSWPNPTFGGVLPNMTKAELNGFAKIGSYLYQPEVSWTSDTASIILNWKKDTYEDFVSYKIYRSTTDDVDEASTLIYDSAEKDVTTYTDTDIDETQRIYYYRLYTYYSNEDTTAGLIRRVVTKIYVDIANTSGIEDGSPEHPYKLLRDGIDAAGNGAKVCVAQGTYLENEGSFWRLSRRPGLMLEGGYESTNWTRDLKAYPTIIDGTGLEGNVIGIYSVNDITIDGFTIKGAYYNGINLNNAAGINVKNCALINNGHQGFAAGDNSTAIIENCDITDNGHDGVAIWQNGNSISVIGCYIARNGHRGINVQRTAAIFNNLIDSNNGTGIECWGSNYDVSIINNTIVNNSGMGGICYNNSGGGNLIIKNNNIANNNGGTSIGIYCGDVTGVSRVITHNNSYGQGGANYSNCGTGAGQNNNISAAPKFVNGPLGKYYLSQTASWQSENSPCVDAGDPAQNPFDDTYTTRTDGRADVGTVDMGYHYPAELNSLSAVVINEFLPNPVGSDSGKEWVEFYNRSSQEIDISGCIVDDIIGDGSGPQTIPAGTIIKAHGFYTMNLPGTYLNNDKDIVHLLWPDGETIIDSYTYASTTEGGSYYRCPDGCDWAYNLDFPATKNSANCPTVAPFICANMDGTGTDEVVVDFGKEYGIWTRYNDLSWNMLHSLSPDSMITGNLDGDAEGRSDIVIDFGVPYGIWIRYNDTYWQQLHNISPESMVIGDLDANGQDDIIIDFGQYGIWIYYNNSSWTQLHGISPNSIVTGNLDADPRDEVIIDFGKDYGIWIYYNNSSWQKLHNISPEYMVTGDMDGNGQDEIVIDFGQPYGLWIYYNNSSWTQLHNISPDSMAIGNIDEDLEGKDELIIDFGEDYGIWIWYNNLNWSQLHSLSPEFMITGNIDAIEQDEIVIDFGYQYGIWVYYNNSTWTKLHDLSP